MYKIQSIKSVGIEDVYDIETNITHSLVANGLCVHNCAEQPLEPFGVCCLGALNLMSFVTEGGNIKWQRMEEVIRLAIRALDNVLDVTWYPLKQMEQTAQNIRRVGLGSMGLADLFFAKELRYGSEKSLDLASQVYKFIRNIAYDESTRLANEKGPFPAFDSSAFCRASFVRKIPNRLRIPIRKHGIRNVALLSGQPTGTISLVANTSAGIEPIPSLAYRRDDNVSSRVYIHPHLLECFRHRRKIPEWLVDAHTIFPEDHLNVLREIVEKVDSNVSKTCNLNKGTTTEQLSDLLLDYMWNLKSITVYVDGSRSQQVIYPMTFKEAKTYLKKKNPEEWKDIEIECKGGVCEL